MRVGGNWDDTVVTNSELTNTTMDVQTTVQNCCCPHSFYPWIKKPYYEPTKDGLNEQIKHFVEWVAPTEEERLMRADVCRRIERVVSKIWPNAVTETIGSTCTDLCVPTSDIDMVIFGVTFPQCNIDGGQSDANAFAIECLYKLAKKLEEVAQKNSIEVLDSAKVPIIKMRDRKSGIEIDISFGVTSGKENSKVVLEYCKKYPLVKPLTLVIKYYLKQKFLNNSWSGGIGSYTLVIMIISYLQLHAKNDEPSESTLADHLIGFFGLYGSKFNYVESVISIVNEGKYLRKSDKNWKNENNPSLLSVEDPHNPDNDVGCIAFKIENAKEAFFQAYNILVESNNSRVTSPASDESNKSYSDFPSSQSDINISQLMWVNYSLQCFRARIKSIYKSCDSTEVTTCPIHPSTKIHSPLNLSSTRYFNNGIKPHKHKICGPTKDSKRLSKKVNNNNNYTYNNNNNINNDNNDNYNNINHNNNNYSLYYNYNSNNINLNNNNNNKNCISFHMDENIQHLGKNWPWEGDTNSKTNRPQDKLYKIVSTDFPGLSRNHGASPVESPSI